MNMIKRLFIFLFFLPTCVFAEGYDVYGLGLYNIKLDGSATKQTLDIRYERRFNNSLFGLFFIFLIYLLRGIVTPILRNEININTASNKRATVLSIRSFIIRISFAIFAPILGYIAENYSLANSFYALAVVVGIFSLLACFRLSKLN